MKVNKGKIENISVTSDTDFSLVVPKGWDKELTYEISLNDSVTAPMQKGEQVGVITYKLKDETVKTCPIVLSEDVEKASVWDYFTSMLETLFG